MNKYLFILNYIFKLIPEKKYNSAITLHDIKPTELIWLKQTIDNLLENYEFVDPSNIELLLQNKKFKNKLLLTFDDGYASCYKICKEIFNPRKIKAYFLFHHLLY